MVLLRIQHFQQRARRVATEIRSQLVDLIQQEQRVARAGLAQVLQHLARQSTDIGTAVPADLCLVTHAAQRHAHVLAAGGLGHGLAQRGLAHARGANQTQDRRLHLVHALLHGKVFQDAVLDALQAVVVLVQDAFGLSQVLLDLGLLAPGQADQHIQIVARHASLGRHGRHQLELLQLGLGLGQRSLGHAGGLDLAFQLFQVGALFAIPQLLLDRLHLLVQVEVALVLFHLALDAATDALVDVENVDFMLKLAKQQFQTLLDVHLLQHFLLVFQIQRQMRGDGVGQTARIVDAGDGRQDFLRDLLVELDVLLEGLHQRAAQRLDLALGITRQLFGNRSVGRSGQHGRGKVFFAFGNGLHLGALAAFHQHLHGAVRQFQQLQDGSNAAGTEHIVDGGLVLGRGFLGHEHDRAACFHGGFERSNALGASHEQRDHHVREHHHIPQGKHGQFHALGGQVDKVRHLELLSQKGLDSLL